MTGAIAGPEEGVPLFWLAAILVRKRRAVGGITALGVLVALALALLRPATYTTRFSFLPQESGEQSTAGLANLAGQFGISLGSGGGAEQSPEFYADLLATRRVLAPIASDSFATEPDAGSTVPLSAFLQIEGDDPRVVLDKTLDEIRKEVISSSVAKRTTGVVTVDVRTRSPYISLAIANRLIDGLTDYNLFVRQSQAREERRFTEGRLEVARAALRETEDALEHFLQTNQQAQAPALTFQRERLQRELMLQERVVTTLAQQYEENRIREVRDTPVVTIIEQPTLAARPDRRHRLIILLIGSAAAFCVAVLVAVFGEMWRRSGDGGPDPALALLREEWRQMRSPQRS